MGNGSDERSVGTEMAADVVYTRATLDQPNLSEGIRGNEAIGGKLTLGSKTHTRTRNNDATSVLQVAEDQSGWDRPRDVEHNLRASGESHDKPTNPTLGPNQSLRGGQQDALSITGQPKQPINEAHEATSPMKLKTKASPFDNIAHLAQDPATNSTQNRKVKLKKIVREISKTQAQDVEMSALCAKVGIKCPGNLEFLEKEESRTQKKPCNDASPPSTKLTPTLTMAAK
nr:hypothetical protein CFP56_76504 [Quercus suber]